MTFILTCDSSPRLPVFRFSPFAERTVPPLYPGEMPVPTQIELERWDAEDPLNWTRAEFEIPSFSGSGGEGKADGEAIYFCGNSLGLLSKKGRKHVIEELDVWSERYIILQPLFQCHGVLTVPELLQDTSTTPSIDLGNTSTPR